MKYGRSKIDEKHFKKIVDQATDLIQYVDIDGRIVYVNNIWKNKLGYSDHEIDNLYIGDIIHPQSKENCRKAFLEANSGKSIENLEAIFISKSGQSIPVEGNVNCNFDDDGFVLGAWGMYRDITKRKKAEEMLRKNEENLRITLNSIGEAVIATDNEGRVTGMNPVAEKLTGWAEDQARGKSSTDIFNIVNALTRQAVGNPVMEVLQNGAAVSLGNHTILLARDGTEYQVADSAAPIYSAEKILTGVVLVFRDVTKQYQVLEALRKSEERLEMAMVAANDGLFDWNLKNNEVYFDKRYFTMAGYEPDEFPHAFEEWAKRVHPEDIEPSSKAIKAHLSGQTSVFDIEFRFLRKDNSWMWIRGRGKILERSEDGTAQRLVGTHADITERKRINESLQLQLDYEKVVSEISSSFVSLQSEELSSGINYALKRAAQLFGVDRSYFFQLSADQKTMSNTHEWCADGIKSLQAELQNIPVDILPWIAKQLRIGDHLCIPDVDKLSQEANLEKERLKQDGVSTLLCLPVNINGKMFGIIGYDAVKNKKKWSEEQILHSKVIAELITSALIRRQDDQMIRYLSCHDQLTGFYNRYFLEKEMERLDTSGQLPITIIMADLNGLKLINDAYGHLKGDEMLKSVSRILNETCREKGLIARWGGDEFVILLPRIGSQSAWSICKRIDVKSMNSFVEDVPVSITMGVASKTDETRSLADVLREAENNMHKQKLTESRSTKNAVVQTLLKTLAEKSFETEEHTCRMQEVAQKIGQSINLPDAELSRLELLITLHDIGKINIAEDILSKKGSLTLQEWEMIKKHPEIGYRIASATEEFVHVAEEILSHHERFDGTGYPRGLKGRDIPLLARITTIADSYEVMSNGRPYKKAMSSTEIRAELIKCAGSHFDPELVEIFFSLLDEK